MSIGGNIRALLQVKGNSAKNSIGACENEWINSMELYGWLDLSSGDSKHTVFSAKVQESTHIFLCDYHPLICNAKEQGKTVQITSENARLIIQGIVYEILLIDNPMNINEHLEIYLRFIGGQ